VGNETLEAELTDEQVAALAELDEALAKFEAQKRWSDVIKTVLAKAEIVVALPDKLALLAEAGRLYVERSSNQAEAIKCFQQVLDLDSSNVEAITRLKEMYEKRRDWERLVAVLRAECALLDASDQALRRVEIAQLATEKLRKPEICIELWQDVLLTEASNLDALAALAPLYERAREWKPLADVLERQSEAASGADLIAILQKLGSTYADKLNDDDGAAAAYKRLLQADPNDRRAQEQLKKRFIALKNWDELEEFYEGTDKWDELIRTVERAADEKDATDEERIALHFRAARLWQEKKDKADRAARAYEKVLSIDETNLDAAVALTPIYEGAGDAKKLASVYEVRLQHITDADERVMLLRETGLLYEEKLRNPQQAFERYLEAFAVDPMRDVPREDIERLAAKVDGWEKVFEGYGKAIEGATHPDDATSLRIAFGSVLRQAGKVDDAIAQYRAVYDDQVDHAGAIGSLDELYRETKNYGELLGVVRRRAELEEAPGARKLLAYEGAKLLDEQLSDPGAAIEAYRSILLEHGDGEREAYSALDSLYERQGLWNELAEALDRRIDLGPETDEELASLKFRLANASVAHLDSKARGLELYREVLLILPEHDGARESLEALLSDPELGGEAAQVLEPLYEGAGNWQSLVRTLEVALKFADDQERKLDLITKMGEVQAEQIGDAAAAFDAYARALREAPGNPGIGARLQGLADEQNRLADYVALLDELATESEDAELARALWMKAAVIHHERLDQIDAAVSAFNKALNQNPGDAEILTALDALYRKAGRWRDLLSILRRRADISADPSEVEELLSQLASVHDENLGEPGEAIRVYGEVLEHDATSARALAALDVLYERQELWSELADNVARRLALVDSDSEQVALMLRLAHLRESRMGAVEAAIETYREVLEREPSNEVALQALERLLAEPEHQAVIAEILEPIFRDANEFLKLIGIHEIQVQHAEAAEQRVALLHKMAELHEVALDDLQSAFRCFARALAEDPAASETQQELDRIAASAQAWQPLAEVYEAQTKGQEDVSLAVSLLAKAAQVREEQLGDTGAAIEHHRRILSLDPQNLEAVVALERLYQLSERYDDLANIYLTKAGILDVPEEQRGYFFRAAAIYEDLLERPLDAIAVYQRSLGVEPDDLDALNKLIELFLRLERWEELLGVYTRKADLVDDPDEKKALYAEVGAVYERELADIERAISTYQRMLEIDPDDLTAIGRLDALYQATENWQELLSVLEREADLSPDPVEATAYRYRIGEIWELRISDATRAVDVYRDILTTLPDHEPTMAALERMIGAGREPLAAAGVLEPVYRAAGESAKLVAILEVQVRHEEDAVTRVDLLHQIAELREIHMDQPREAFDAFARALPIDSQREETLQSLERLAEQLAAWPEVGRLYDLEVNRLRETSPDNVADLALRLAQIFEVQIGDVDAAIQRYRIVHEADPGHVQTIEALDRLYEATERWADLAEILHKEIDVAESPDDVLTLQFRIGQIRQRHLGQVAAAIEQYKEILAAAPEHAPSLAALEDLFQQGVQPLVIGEILDPLYRMQDAWDKLVGVQEVALGFQADPEERVATMHRIAEIAEQRAGDDAAAFVWMQRALLEAPGHDHTVGEVERLAATLDGWAVLANTYADILEQPHSKEALLSAGRRVARIYEDELVDVQRAEEAYRFILGRDELDVDALEALDRIYSEHGAAEALAEVLRKRVAATTDARDKVELSFRLGEVLSRDLSRFADAIAVYQSVLDKLDPQHEESIRALRDIYIQQQDWPNLYAAHEKELSVVVGDSSQAEVLGKMAWLASERLGDLPRAVELLRRVLDLAGEDPGALNALGNIYAVQENWAELVDVLEREVSVTDDEPTRVRIYSDLGRVWYEKLHRDRNALENWERVLDLDPASTDALFAMAQIHRAAGAQAEVVDTLHRLIDVGGATLEDSALEAVYMELGAIYSTGLEQPADAVDAYTKASEINPRNFAALEALERIHTDQAEWNEVVGVRLRRVDAFETAEQQVEELLSVAKVWAEQLEQPDEARSAFARILNINPLHDYAFQQLEQLHKAAQRFEELIELYLARVEAADDTTDRVRLLRSVAQSYERDLQDRQQAFDALLIAWTQDYADEETAAELERVAGLTQRWNELLATANQSLEGVDPSDTDTKIAICLKCAKWYGRAGHPEYAIPALQQVLAIDPLNLPAMRQMAALYRQTQQWEVYAQVLGRIVEMTEDPTEKADVYVKMGELSDQQFNLPEQAIDHYKEALKAVSTHLGGLLALEHIYTTREQWRDLIKILTKKVEAVADTDELLAAKLQLAEAYEDRLKDKDKAIEHYQGVLQVEPRSLPALKGLERLYAQTERWQDLLSVLETELEVVSTEKERIQLLTRIASMWEEEFVKPEKASERLEQVVEIDPTHTDALQGLARLYKQMRKWPDLVRTYERHIDVTPDRSEKIALYCHIGETYRVELEDNERAVDAYLNVTSIDEDHLEALDALTRLYDKRGEHSQALDTMERLSRLIEDPEQQVDLLFRMGKLFEEKLSDRVSALESFQRAIDANEKHLPSLEAMRDIHLADSDWHAASRVLEQAVEVETTGRRAAELRVELGRLYDDKLDEHERAIEAFEAAHKIDADNEDAALPLVDEYIKTERYSQAEPLLQMLVRRAGGRETSEQHRLWYQLGQCAEHTADNDEAIRAYGQAFGLDAQDLASLTGLAAAYYRAADWEKAFKYYQMVLVHHRDELSSPETTDTFYRLGVIKREQNEQKKALNMFDKALEEDPHHRPTLEALVKLYAESNDFEQVIRFKKQIVEDVLDGEERFTLLEEIGDLWAEKAKNPAKAIEAYAEAADIKPDNHQMLHKLLGLYQSTRQWEAAIGIIDRVAELDGRAKVQSKYAYTVGVILRDEMKDPDAAVDRFNKALDLDPTQLKPFEAINKIYTVKKDWKQLERAFRKLLHRMSESGVSDATLEFNLWHNLGVIYRDRLNSLESAGEAFRMASRMQPDNMQEHQILAELFAMIPERLDDAIAEHQLLLKNDPYRVDSYRALYKLYFGARSYDKAWCLASALTFLGKADTEQKQFFEQYRPRAVQPRTALTNERWVKDVFHPEEDYLVGKVFESITNALVRLRAQTDKQLGLDKQKPQVLAADAQVMVTRSFGFFLQAMNMTANPPRLYVVRERPGGLGYLPSIPPSSVCGSALVQGVSPSEVAFLVAKHLSYYRPEHYIRTLFQTKDEMKMVLLAAMRIAGATIPDPTVTQWADQIRQNMQPADVELLNSVGKRFVEAGARTDIKQWMQMVELTACRAGFLLCGDLEAAAKMIQAEPPFGATDIPPKDKIKEVVLFSVSESYFRLRESLGIQIKVG